jgi:3'-phosphoadenosine 5'-phosphosulfate sulfotransferase (PAPS reductase)/FAD synthetase
LVDDPGWDYRRRNYLSVGYDKFVWTLAMTDPFRIIGPAVISFSGGRTSAYMLWRVVQAHGGTLPDDVVVLFANTGREMPATLQFVRDVATNFGVHVRWLEYRHEPGRHFYEEVGHNSASTNGEPFEAYLSAKPTLPNPVQRSCTTELKIRTIKRFVVAELGWKRWTSIIGLRADELVRVERAAKPQRDRWKNVTPLATAGITKADVLAFWRAQSFDLQLAGPWEGNCDGCFLKSRASTMWMIRTHPERMAWWADMEAVTRGAAGRGRRFRKDIEPQAKLAEIVASMPMLPFDETMHEEGAACGGGCGI